MKLSEIRQQWHAYKFLWDNNLDNYPKDRLRDYVTIAELRAELAEANRLKEIFNEAWLETATERDALVLPLRELRIQMLACKVELSNDESKIAKVFGGRITEWCEIIHKQIEGGEG